MLRYYDENSFNIYLLLNKSQFSVVYLCDYVVIHRVG